MAKKVKIDVEVKGQGTKKVALDAKNAGDQLNKVSTNAGTANRNIKGVAAASSGASKNFSKMSQGMNAGIVPAYATLAANVFAMSAAFRFFKKAADLAILKESQVSYAQSTGTAIKTLTANLQEASGGMLTFKSSAEAAAIGMAKGFTPEQMNSLAIGARKVSAALGRDFEDAFDRLVRGVSKAEPELLDELGITLRLANATERYGNMVGKTAKELTEYERSQAVMLEVQRQLNEQFGDQKLQANPYQQLMVTMDNLITKITEKVMPIFDAIAMTINRSAGAAVSVFGLIGISILKSMPFIQNFNTSIDTWVAKQTAGYKEAETALISYYKQIKAGNIAEAKAATAGKGAAKSIIGKGSKSKVLERFSEGKMKGADEYNLKKALAAAEIQLTQHGKIVKGIFANATKEEVEAVKHALAVKNSAWRRHGRKVGNVLKGIFLVGKMGYKGMVGVAKWSFGKIGKAAGFAGKMMGKAFAFAGWIGMLKMIWEGWKTLQTKIHDVIIAFLRGVEKLMNSGVGQMIRSVIGGIIETVGGGVDWISEKLGGMVKFLLGIYQKILEFMSMIPGKLGEMAGTAAGGLAAFRETSALLQGTNIAQMGTDMKNNADQDVDLVGRYEKTGMGQWSLETQTTSRAADEANQEIAAFRDTLSTVSEEMGTLESAVSDTNTAIEAGTKIATYLGSISFGSILEKANELTESSNDITFLNEALTMLGTSGLPTVIDALAAYDKDGNVNNLISSLNEMGATGGMAVQAETSFKNNVETLRDSLRNPGDLDSLATALENTKSQADLATAAYTKLGESTDIGDRLNEATGGSYVELKTVVDDLINSGQILKLEEIDRNKRAEEFHRSGTLVAKHLKERLELEVKGAAIQQKLLEIKKLNLALERAEQTKQQTMKSQRDLEIAEAELERLKDAKEGYERDITDTSKLALSATNALGTGIASAFDGLVMGTKTVKEAFADMAMGVIQSLSKMLAEMMAAKIMMSIMGVGQGPTNDFTGTGLGDFFAQAGMQPGGGSASRAIGQKLGGIVKDGSPVYAGGGVAKGPRSGYPATLHGTEAVVPLPGGRAIPVSMTGGANNIVVNVSGSGGGGTTTEGQDSEGLGRAIASAVQAELQNQKRSGGILNPYGVA